MKYLLFFLILFSCASPKNLDIPAGKFKVVWSHDLSMVDGEFASLYEAESYVDYYKDNHDYQIIYEPIQN